MTDIAKALAEGPTPLTDVVILATNDSDALYRIDKYIDFARSLERRLAVAVGALDAMPCNCGTLHIVNAETNEEGPDEAIICERCEALHLIRGPV